MTNGGYTPREITAVLRRMLVILNKGEHWTHFTIARNRRKEPVPFYADSAVYWDIQGAVHRAALGDGALADQVVLALRSTVREIGWRGSLVDYNDADNTTWKDVERLVTITIESYRHS